MKTMKKMLVLVLALMMVVSLALPAMAADTYTITIQGSKTNNVPGSSDGHTYEAYQILSGTMAADALNLGDPQWGANIDGAAFLEDLRKDTYYGEGASNIFSAVTDAKGFASVIAQTSFTTAQLEYLASVMNKHLTGTPADISEEENAPYTLEVEAGYYLIKDKDGSLSGVNKDYTDFILHISQNVTVYHKGSIPTVEKTVSEANSAYHESIEMAMQREYYYKLVGTLPSDFDDYTSYEYTFVDTLSKGIDYVGVESVIAVYNATKSEEPLTGYTLTTTDNADGTTTLKIHFDDLKHDGKHPFQPGDKIIVIYKAKLNENAIVGGTGNDNAVHLEYSNNPNGDGLGKTSTDGAKVYTYALNVTKIDGKTQTPLEGVTFVLYREIKKADNAPSDFEYAKVDSTGAITAWVANEEDASVLTTDVNGQFKIEGLDTNVTYSLLEKSTLAGYNQILEPINIYLTAEKDANGAVTTVWMEDNTHVTDIKNYVLDENTVGVEFNVPNYMGDVLPSTGGMGTTIFYILGSVMVLGAVLLLITKKRVAA